jgi:hypothetical protein
MTLTSTVLGTIDNFPRRTPVRELHKALNNPYIYDYIKNYAGNKQKAYKIMEMLMFSTYDKANPDTEDIIRGLNKATVILTTVQVPRLPL